MNVACNLISRTLGTIILLKVFNNVFMLGELSSLQCRSVMSAPNHAIGALLYQKGHNIPMAMVGGSL